jgi:hypothetical protein
MATGLVCLECWVSLDVDPFHFDCTGEHFMPKAEADEVREWINGRYEFMARTGQRELRPDSGAVV